MLLGHLFRVCQLRPPFHSKYGRGNFPSHGSLEEGHVRRGGGEQQAALKRLKLLLTTPLALRIADPYHLFKLITEASDLAVGAVLLQDFGEGLQPIAYELRKLNQAERNYPVHDKELLAIVHTFKVWRCYLMGAGMTVRTDHKSLQFICARPTLNPRQIRWLDYLNGNDTILVVVDRLPPARQKLLPRRERNCSSQTSCGYMASPRQSSAIVTHASCPAFGQKHGSSTAHVCICPPLTTRNRTVTLSAPIRRWSS
ncbi:hypothetical protein CLOP_g1348 [Closterium sp. NIES-67]|nr:hypothetical protein CLOP_g1348 [Closterium sp. NIES-67]